MRGRVGKGGETEKSGVRRKKMRGRGAMHRNRGENEMRKEGREGR